MGNTRDTFRISRGISSIFIIIIVSLVILIIGGVLFLQKSSQAPQKAPPIPTYSTTPEQTTENFYKWYLDCLNRYFQSESGKSLQEDCPYQTNKYTSFSAPLVATGFDPVLCAQNTPNLDEGSITIDKATIFGNKATTTIRSLYSWKDHPIKVELGLFNNQWKITNITCLPPQ